ncbi:S-layer homology domain-containing protein [Paenibacillus radicis (ex Xue et al. 2023)]|uniref:S-layer homology domain-containing protein n=1 Tax=Paenibacillus radicis (ex Xue et al. 2023) TaxID=2972489 RepID=A0ABT1YG23_9BACL|nr:S-layer homology domain-containing protein [Paenibacillus radicis (ex Xue et al. 2023)]MCR8632153.1 S-layer homology domain-containing protein [Paenibacillus radicis (ex Xue et al. 2023)]
MIVVKRVVNILISVLLVLSMFPAIGFAETGDGVAAPTGTARAGTWFETAYATWTGKSVGGYRAYVRTLGAKDWRDNSPITGWLVDWKEVDAQLVRKVDPARNTWRVDIPGLPRGEYEIQVRATDGTTVLHSFTELKTSSFPRNGAAFVPSNVNTFPGTHNFALNGAIGGYLPDGREDPNAKIIYVTHENVKTSLPADVFTAGRGSTANARTPLVIRFLGTVGSFNAVTTKVADSGQVGPSWMNDSREILIGAGNGNVTFEGIGPDATIFGWGISTNGAHNLEFRNLHFDQFYEDAIEIHGGGTSVRASNVWVHHNTFGYGQNKYLNLNQDPDQAKGDGATDITNHARNYTVSYNKYVESSKVLLIGGGTTSMSNHYGTIDHNWFSGTGERTPRVRNGRVHVFNNLYEDVQGTAYHNQLLDRSTGYGIGGAHNATIWAEGNIFVNVNYPFLRSRQGHARGSQAIDYMPGPGETSTANAGFNHFFGDAPGFIIAKEDVTDGDFPSSIAGFRNTSDYMPGLTDQGLQDLKTAVQSLQPNILDESSRMNFDPKLDIGVVVAAGSTTTNPAMTTSPASQLDWSFRPADNNVVWPTGTVEQADALKNEIKAYAGALHAVTPDSAPAAPVISNVKVNDEKRSAFSDAAGTFIPSPGKIVVYKDTFTIGWVNKDVTTDHYEIQWDKGSNNWETLGTVTANSRPTTFITQSIDQFANLKSILAQADNRNATYAFRIKAGNSFGESDWSNIYAISGDDLLVTFNTDGGSTVAPQRVRVGDAITVPARPKKDGWVFVGWYTDKTTSVHMWDFLNEKVAGSTELHAKWVKVDATHRLLNAYASAEELESPYVAATLQTLGTLSTNGRDLTLPAGTTVYVAPGVYWTDLTYKEGGVIASPNIGLSIQGQNISFIGLTADATETIICGNRGEGGETGLGANGSWYSLGISSGFHSENITIANYAQQDLVYPRDPSQNISKRIDSKNHAEVLTRANGTGAPDKLYFKNTRFVGYLNMMLNLAPTRAYFLDSFFQQTDDSIFAGGVNVYENSTFNFFGNHPSVSGAGSGGINALLGSTIVGMPQMTSTDVYLAKTSNAIGSSATGIYAIIDTKFTGRIQSVEWENVVREDARHFVSNNTIGEGRTPLVISPSQPQTSVSLSGDALKAFKVGEEYNVYNLLKGTDGWDPKGQNNADWAPYTNLPYRFLIGATGKTMYSDKTDATNKAVLTPAPAPANSVDVKNTAWSYDTNLLNGTVNATTGVITLTAKPNNTGAIVKTIVTGTLPSGMSAGATLYIRPLPVPAPVVAVTAINISENLAKLSYTLDQLGYKDTSVIEWYRETGPDTTNGIHIGTMRNDANELFVDDPFKNYALNKYDVGYYLRAVITPKYEFSSTGAPITVYTTRAVTSADVTEKSLYTDFKNLYVTNENNTTTKGRWFFDRVSGTAVPWGWGIGSNGTDKIWGLQNNSGGTSTRFVFGQTGSYGDMSLILNYSTSKVEGQGFGGNTQFMDIYVKYDPATRTGYYLHVERTAAGGSNATIWTLYKDDGTTQTALSEPLKTAAMMPKSTITVSVTGSTLRVQASTLSEKTPLQTEQNLPNSVDISWTDTTGALGNNMFGGFGIRINNTGNSAYDYGNTGTNNTVMLHNVRVNTTERAAIDTTAPVWPVGSTLASSNTTQTGTTLTWTTATDNVGITGYKIYNGTSLLQTVTSNVYSYAVTGLTAGTSYTFSVKAVDDGNNLSEAKTVNLTTLASTDTTAPVWPAGSTFTASNTTQTGTTLTWTTATDNVGVTGYKIYNGSSLLQTVTSNVYSYAVTGLTAGTSYTFSVKAVDNVNNLSEAKTVNVTTLASVDATAPVWPAGSTFTASNTTQTGTTLTWTAATDNVGVTGYKIYNGSSLLQTVTSNVYSYAVTGLTAGTSYTFSVKAVDNVNNLSEAKTVNVTTLASADTTAPDWPAGSTLAASNTTQTGTTLTWTAATDNVGVTGFKVYQGSTLLTTVTSAVNSFNVTGLTAGTTYTFAVQAGDAAGNWTTSGPNVTVTTEVIHRSGGSSTTSASPSSPGTPAEPTTPASPSSPETPASVVSTTPGQPVFDLSKPESVSVLKEVLKEKLKSSNESVTFKDVSEHWSAESINVFSKLGLVNGYEDGTFKPNAPITRGEFAAIVAKTFNIGTGELKTAQFSDINGSWAKEAILALASNGIINGYEDGTFYPESNITRAEMIAIIARIINLTTVQGTSSTAFTDIGNSWNKGQIEAATKAGIINGTGEGSFAPDKNSTRAEALTVLLRSLKLNPEIASLINSLK